MHACDEDHFVVGIHVLNNWLLCSDGVPLKDSQGFRLRYINGDDESPSQITVDGTTMHGCPDRFVVKGFHEAKNLLLCESVPIDVNDVIADFGTQRDGMHACPVGRLVKGIHVAQNILACVRMTSTSAATTSNLPALTFAFALMLSLGGYRLWRKSKSRE
jgi:hypothetical protein